MKGSQVGDPTTPIPLAERRGAPQRGCRASPISHPLLGGQMQRNGSGCVLCGRFVFFCFFLIYIPAFAEVTGFDPLSVQGTGVGIGYNHLRWLAVTHHPFPFRYPYHPASGRAFMHSLVGTSYVRRGGEQAKGSRGNWAVTDRVQFLVSTANQALCPVCEQGPRPTRIPCCCA